MKRLNNLKLMMQTKDSSYCGSACIKMVLEYYQRNSPDWKTLWSYISDISPNGRSYCKTYKMGKFLEQNNLLTSIVCFTNLDSLLQYCKKYEIPGILNIHSFENNNLGHFIVFKNFRKKTVFILDPENDKRQVVKYENLKKMFIRNSIDDEIGPNIALLCSEHMQSGKKHICKYCYNVNIIHNDLKEIISGFVCKECDTINTLE